MHTLVQYAVSTVIGIGLVHLLCRLLRLKPVQRKVSRPRRSAICSLLAVLATMLILTFILAISHRSGPAAEVVHKGPPNLLDQAIMFWIYLLPMTLMLRLNRDTISSIGFSKTNLWKVAVVTVLLLIVTIVHGGAPLAALKLLLHTTFLSLTWYGVIGFGEEILFRGYLQSRLISWLGKYGGWILASLIMALAHVPGRAFSDSGLAGAIESSLRLMGPSLLTGYLMMRTGSVSPPALVHVLWNLN